MGFVMGTHKLVEKAELYSILVRSLLSSSPSQEGEDDGRYGSTLPDEPARPKGVEGGGSMSGEEFETEPSGEEFANVVVIKYNQHEVEKDIPLSLDDLLAVAREWGIKRFVTDPPLTRDSFPINQPMTITLIPRDKAA